MTKAFVASQREADWSACLSTNLDLGRKDNPRGSWVPPKGSAIVKRFLSFRPLSRLTQQSSPVCRQGQSNEWDPLALCPYILRGSEDTDLLPKYSYTWNFRGSESLGHGTNRSLVFLLELFSRPAAVNPEQARREF